jgi:hypothetical protein
VSAVAAELISCVVLRCDGCGQPITDHTGTPPHFTGSTPGEAIEAAREWLTRFAGGSNSWLADYCPRCTVTQRVAEEVTSDA